MVVVVVVLLLLPLLVRTFELLQAAQVRPGTLGSRPVGEAEGATAVAVGSGAVDAATDADDDEADEAEVAVEEEEEEEVEEVEEEVVEPLIAMRASALRAAASTGTAAGASITIERGLRAK